MLPKSPPGPKPPKPPTPQTRAEVGRVLMVRPSYCILFFETKKKKG